jgi:hypothetical protein
MADDLPLQDVDLIDIDRLLVAEQGNHNCETDCGFRGRNCHGEKHERLPGDVPEV